MNKTQMYNPPHPGEVLKEMYIDSLDLTITEVAKGLQVARKTLSSLVNMHTGISPEMAIRLSKAFNTTPELWLNMQLSFDLFHAKETVDIDSIKVFA